MDGKDQGAHQSKHAFATYSIDKATDQKDDQTMQQSVDQVIGGRVASADGMVESKSEDCKRAIEPGAVPVIPVPVIRCKDFNRVEPVDDGIVANSGFVVEDELVANSPYLQKRTEED